MEFYSNPKRKEYVLNPRAKALYEDSNRFGTKMLEKMGWSKGQGLGAKLDGNLDFIKVSHKSDQKGVGFKDRDNQWTQHEDNFNTLLKSFDTKSGENTDNDDVTPGVGFGSTPAETKAVLTKETVFSGVSLEEQSKKSRARVHYKKFTRGKDLARYSEKDLANIFGKRTLNEQHVQPEPEPQDKDKAEAEKNFGITVIETGTSINDYFKAKMESIRNGRKAPDGSNNKNPFYIHKSVESVQEVDVAKNIDEVSISQEESVEIVEVPKSKKSKKKRNVSAEDIGEVSKDSGNTPPIPDAIMVAPEADHCSPKEKSKKKNKKLKLPQNDGVIEENSRTDIFSEGFPKKEKKSKKKSKSIDSVSPVMQPLSNGHISGNYADEDDFVVMKQKNAGNPEDEIFEIPNLLTSPIVEKKKKKTRSSPSLTQFQIDQTKSKKSKSAKRCLNEADTSADTDNTQPTKIRKKNKKLAYSEVIPKLHYPKLFSNVLNCLYAKEPDIVPTVSDDTTAAAADVNSFRETFEIAKYKAEIFRFFDLDGFVDSNLSDINGYGYTEHLQLKVVEGYRDDMRINNFWDRALVNKYGSDVIKIKKESKKKKYSIKALKKKNVFKF